MDLEHSYLAEALFTLECCESIRLVEAEELGRRWVGIDKEDFSELVRDRLAGG